MQVFGSYVSSFTARVMIPRGSKGLDVPFGTVPADIRSGEYRAVDPVGRVPALAACP